MVSPYDGDKQAAERREQPSLAAAEPSVTVAMQLANLLQFPECLVKDLLSRFGSSLLSELLESLGAAAVLDKTVEGPSRASLAGSGGPSEKWRPSREPR
jgi:hypothetical protein